MNRQVAWFLGLTFAANYGLVGLFLALGGAWQGAATLVVPALYMFVPMVMAIVTQRLILRQPVAAPLGIRFRLNRWFLVAWLLPIVLAIAVMGVSLLMPGVVYSPDLAGLAERMKDLLTPEQSAEMRRSLAELPVHPFWIGVVQSLVAGATINAIAAFGEELGWRGFLYKEWIGLGFWRASFLTGLVWGVWHAPLILLGHNYPQHPILGVFLMTVWCLLLSPLFSYIRLRSGSVIAAAIMHGTINATPTLAVMLVAGGNDLTVGWTGLAGLIVAGIATLALYLFDRRPESQVPPLSGA